MIRLLKTLLIGVALTTALSVSADPAPEQDFDARRYTDAMRDTLRERGIEVTRADLRRNQLFVDYRVTTDGPLPEFALGAVLALAQPIADGADDTPEAIRVRNITGGRQLMLLSLSPDQTEHVLRAIVSEDEREQIAALQAATVAACAVGESEQ